MKKKFDAVEFQRKVREELSREYCADPKAFLRKLKEEYGHLQKRKRGADAR
ncbi:MAG: hypothetical protein JW759_00545 [Candidatus Coatesbacteria bacterium]|nr:hypothetical protein [Candidatus Coatesbacteria bacterium]